jgi:hypothetical protein
MKSLKDKEIKLKFLMNLSLLIIIIGTSLNIQNTIHENKIEELEQQIKLTHILYEDLINQMVKDITTLEKEIELLKLNKNLTIENAVLNKTLELKQELFLCYRELDREKAGYYSD